MLGFQLPELCFICFFTLCHDLSWFLIFNPCYCFWERSRYYWQHQTLTQVHIDCLFELELPLRCFCYCKNKISIQKWLNCGKKGTMVFRYIVYNHWCYSSLDVYVVPSWCSNLWWTFVCFSHHNKQGPECCQDQHQGGLCHPPLRQVNNASVLAHFLPPPHWHHTTGLAGRCLLDL